MRRSVLLLASLGLVVLLVSGVAWAVTKDCKAGADYCVGTEEPDTLNGSEVKDKMYGLGEVDLLLGSGGDDRLLGGPGNDTVKGGAGNDRIDGDDPEADAGGVDKLYGQGGNDSITDYPYDRSSDTEEEDLLSGGKGDDWLYGTNTLNGGPGDDTIETYSPSGYGPARTITGGTGKDTITSTWNHDDTIYVQDGERDKVRSCAEGTDTVYFDRRLDEVNPTNCENRITEPPPE